MTELGKREHEDLNAEFFPLVGFLSQLRLPPHPHKEALSSPITPKRLRTEGHLHSMKNYSTQTKYTVEQEEFSSSMSL